MALTGRTALLAALGSLPVGIWDTGWTGLLAVNAPLALACACDYALAAPVRRLLLTRSGDTAVRLGETADVTLTITNPTGRPCASACATRGRPAAGSPARRSRRPAIASRSPRANAAASPPACAPPAAATATPTA